MKHSSIVAPEPRVNVSQQQALLCGCAAARSSLHDEWLSFIRAHVLSYRLDKAIPKDPRFRVEARVRSHNGFSVSRFKTNADKSRLTRDATDIGRDNRVSYTVFMSLHGELEFSQLGRDSKCDPTQLILLATGEPLIHTKLGENDTVIFVMPKPFVDQRVIGIEDKCMRPVGAIDGLGHMVRNTLKDFQEAAVLMTESEFQHAACLVGDLILLAINGRTDVTSQQQSVRAAGLARAKQVIRSRLADPDLTLADIAQDCGISLGYLHKLFRDDGRSVWEFLKLERLQRARQLLESTPGCRVTVTTVAFDCGFGNASQFSTAFKRAFGLSPRDVLEHH